MDPVLAVDVVLGVVEDPGREGEFAGVVAVLVATGVGDEFEGDDTIGEVFVVPVMLLELHGRACTWRRNSTKTRTSNCCIFAWDAKAHLSRPGKKI